MLTVLVVLLGVAIALLGLLAIVRERFWLVAVIAVITAAISIRRLPPAQRSACNARLAYHGVARTIDGLQHTMLPLLYGLDLSRT